MKLGKIMALAMIGLSLVSAAAVAMSFTQSDDNAIVEMEQKLMSQYEIYDKKKMYEDAASTYRQLLNNHPDDEKMFKEYSDYCTQHEFHKESYDVCKNRIDRQAAAEGTESDPALLRDETWPFERVMDYMYSNGNKEFYIELHRYINTFRMEKYPNISKYLTELYATTRGELNHESGQYTEILPWSGNFTLAKTNEDKYCVINSTGKSTGISKYGKIYSYSPSENLIACVHEDQMVYMNFSGSRKRVPFDRDKMQLLNYEYLGPFSNGIANIQLSENEWGYIICDESANIGLIMNRVRYATPVVGNVGAVKTDNGWNFFYCGKNGLTNIDGTYSDVYIDENGNALSGFYITENNSNVYVVTAFVKANSSDGWTPVLIRLSEEGASVTQIGTEQYSDVTPFDGYASVCLDGKWKVIDSSGNTVFSTEYDRLGAYGCGFVSCESEGKWGYISIDGNTLIEPAYESAIKFNSSGTAFVKQAGLWHPIRLKEYVFKEEV